MGIPVIIYGKSGSGKSRSMKFFGEDDIFLVNVEGKDLPFQKKFKYVIKTDSVDLMLQQMQKMPCNVAVIDDAGYLMTHHFMDNHRNKKAGASFEMYDDIADKMYNLVRRIKVELPPEKIVYILLHEDTDDYGNTKLRTIGKLLDSKVCLEGMVTICIRCVSDMGQHWFRVTTDGNDITKTPEEMFDEDKVENNLKVVDEKIRAYYGISAEEVKEEKKK